MILTIGFSPCPNDTFIFDAMVHGKIDTRGIQFRSVLEDVETLNLWAEAGKLDITKLSYNAFLNNVQKYALLHSGSALGKGVGPLLIRSPKSEVRDLGQARIAIPGKQTTANLLLSLAHPEARNKTEVLFSDIEEAVLKGDFDAGLVIHESRFTYAQRGLELIEDMGDWWESHAGAAIPLGGIAIRRNHSAKVCATVDAIIRESVQYAWKQYPNLPPFVTEHAQEMDEAVMRKHIGLYVNEYSEELGPVGEQAIRVLFRKAFEAGLIPDLDMEQIFY
jgi:1,4-dihydroxy-6-naphthoate synthase